MITFFLIMHLLATILLGISIAGTAKAYKIPVNLNFILSSLIGLGGIFACTLLIKYSLLHYFIYGAITAAFMTVLMITGKAKPTSGAISCVLSFFFFPEYICFTLFTILNINADTRKDN
jgi:hypothetical protein